VRKKWEKKQKELFTYGSLCDYGKLVIRSAVGCSHTFHRLIGVILLPLFRSKCSSPLPHTILLDYPCTCRFAGVSSLQCCHQSLLSPIRNVMRREGCEFLVYSGTLESKIVHTQRDLIAMVSGFFTLSLFR